MKPTDICNCLHSRESHSRGYCIRCDCKEFITTSQALAARTANQITATLLIEIPKRFPDIRVWRNNRVDAMAIGKNGKPRRIQAGIDGQADISGIIGPWGYRLEIEVKAGKDEQSESQIAFQQMIEKHGGIYAIAREDIEATLTMLGRL